MRPEINDEFFSQHRVAQVLASYLLPWFGLVWFGSVNERGTVSE